MNGLLTLAMIVKNEEVFLPRCLASAAPAVDHMVIVDTGSTDGTVDIARSFGATVVSIDWPNDFSQARNVSLSRVTTPWVLVMDADEVLVADDIPALRQAVTTPSADAYNLRIVSLANQAENISESYVTRLFRSHPEIRFSGAIHEQILPALSRFGMSLAPANIRLLHFGYMDNVSAERNKNERNRQLLLAALAENPDDSYLHWQLSQTYLGMERGEDAVRQAQKTLSALVPAHPLWPLAQLSYAKGLLLAGHPKRCLRVLAEGQALHPRYTDFMYFRGAVHMQLGQWNDARQAFAACLEMGEAKGYLMTETGIGGFKPLFRLAQCAYHLGNPKEAVAYALTAIKQQPTFRSAWDLLFLAVAGSSIAAVAETVKLVLPPNEAVAAMAAWPNWTANEQALHDYLVTRQS